MNNERKFVSLTSRLATYGLAEREQRLVNLTLAPHETLLLTAADKDLQQH